MSSRSSSRLCVPWVVSSFLSGRLIAFLLLLFVSWGVSFLVSFNRLVLLVRFVLLICVSRGRRRPSVSSYRLVRGVLLARLVFFIRLIALRICDEAFLRRRRAIRIIPMGVLLVRSVLVRTGSVRRYPLPALRYPVMRR